MKKARKRISNDRSAEVLFRSDHTCCICRDSTKQVQIHHIDEDPSNNRMENLAVLCFECHTKTQMEGGFVKKLSAEEVILYRDDWYRLVDLRRKSVSGLSVPFEPEMLLIPAGDFLMGSASDKDLLALENEFPQRSIYLPDYYISRTPITNEHYAAFVKALDYVPPSDWQGGNPPNGKRKYPVTSISWKSAIAYCDWLSVVIGKHYTLPSEAEWEKAARGNNFIYPWGDVWEPGRCNARDGGKGTITPVGVYLDGVSPYGVLDMAGNVREWTRSILKEYPYDPEDGREELLTAPQAIRVVRGGAYNSERFDVRCARRCGDNPDTVSYKLGFRIVCHL